MVDEQPLSLLVRKLELRVALDADDVEALMALPYVCRSVARHTYLAREGGPPADCTVLLTGYAYREKVTKEGRRQIVSLHYPGDALDFQTLFLEKVDHSIVVLTHAQLAAIPRTALQVLAKSRPSICAAIQADVAAEASILRAWMTNIGQRDAAHRLAHLLCEFAAQSDAHGLNSAGSYELPMIQEQIGDTLSLTAVHVNRTLKALEEVGLIQRAGRAIVVPNIGQLKSFAGFDPDYLHLKRQKTIKLC